MRLILLLLLLVSCGKKTIYTYPAVPANEASPAVRSEINSELERLEKDFSDIDVNIHLKKLPVVVSPLPLGIVGRCQYGEKNEGAYIILSPYLFSEPQYIPLDAELFEKDFVRVLIHEIGHCYFHRRHEPPSFLESPGSYFELLYNGQMVRFDKIPNSVMPAESTYRMPKALRKYYLSELASKARLTSLNILSDFTEFQIIHNDEETISDP